MNRMWLLAGIAVGVLAGATSGGVINVGPGGSIQAAVDAAQNSDEIVVAPGTYSEAINFLGKAIWLRSSDGAEVTTIDGTGFLHVVQCVSSEGPDTVLEGFTITGGNANGLGGPDSRGGGMHNQDSSPTVINCTFTGNSASQGGGMYSRDSDVTVINCTFSANTAVSGGGGGMHNDSLSPTVIGCSFIANTASSGGGMQNESGSPTVIDCTFSGNSATGVGGGMQNQGSSPTVTNCTFSANTAELSGGGMINDGPSSPTIGNCIFEGNTSGGGGGAIRFVTGDDTTILGCTFTGNSADFGGAVFNSGDLLVANCSFTDNVAVIGGAVFNNEGLKFPQIVNCTMTGNVAAAGGAVANDDFTVLTIRNSIVQGNTPNAVAGTGLSATIIQYSNFATTPPGPGNISDSCFADQQNGDFSLAPGSPCIDAGHNWAIAGISDTDLDANPRFAADKNDFDPGCGIPVVVDMGAYEYQGDPFPVQLGDINGDGVVGINDFLDLLADWGKCSEICCLADLDLDENVGINDFLILLGNWG